MVKCSGDGDDPYRGVLDEWAREQQLAAAAHAREGDKTAQEGDNGGREAMTEEWLEQIRVRVEAASSGPWYGELREVFNDGPTDDFDWIPAHYDGRTPEQTAQQDADTAFIAHARTDIPALLGMVARLERENEALREIVQAVVATMGSTWQWHACPFCGEDSRPGYVLSGRRDPIEHAPDCPVTKARALLAGKEGDGG